MWQQGEVCIAFSPMPLSHDHNGLREWLCTLAPSKNWRWLKQVHGSDIVAANTSTIQTPADGLWTDAPDTGLVVFGRDCPGLILIGKTYLLAAHCGWRGIAKQLPTLCAKKLESVGEDLSTAHAFIGPCISAEAYEVDDQVISAYPWPKNAIKPISTSHALLDLRESIRAQLNRAGISKVSSSDLCTAGDPRLCSHRANGPGPSHALAVYRKPKI